METQSSEFGLAAPPFLGQPESTSLPRQTQPQCNGQLSGSSGSMVQQQEIGQTPQERVMTPREPLQPLDDSWWTQSIAHSIEQAKQQGLSHQVMHDSTFWECHFCMVTVPEQFLGSHLASNKHQRYVLWSKQLVDLESQRANGEFPPWKDIKNGCAYCTVCKKPATETHISSLKHINAISYSVFASAASSSACSSHQPGTLTQPPSSPACAIPPFPSHWGDLDHFEWKVNACQYFCKLCWKWADDPHVWSNDHLRRVSWLPVAPTTRSNNAPVFAPPPPRSRTLRHQQEPPHVEEPPKAAFPMTDRQPDLTDRQRLERSMGRPLTASVAPATRSNNAPAFAPPPPRSHTLQHQHEPPYVEEPPKAAFPMTDRQRDLIHRQRLEKCMGRPLAATETLALLCILEIVTCLVCVC